MTTNGIETVNLVKQYEEKIAVNGINYPLVDFIVKKLDHIIKMIQTF